jgi:hypothetical protein
MSFPTTLRTICLAAVTVALFQAQGVAATADSILANSKPGPYTELDTDRPGRDYKSFELDSNFNICESVCNRESACIAWTWVKPGVQGQKARCWLKSSVPAASHNGCCVSGLKPGNCDSGWYWDAPAKVCRQRIN